MIQEGKAITLRDGDQTISLSGLKAALLFIDAQQKRVGSETAWIKKGDEPPLSVPPAPALKEVAVVNPTPTPLSLEERNDLLDYGNWRMNGLRCSLQARWRFDGQRFRLVRYAAEPTCDNWHGPDAWPTLWITR